MHMKNRFRIAVLASGNGSNAEEIFKHFRQHPTIEVAVVLSNNPAAFVRERAKSFSIPFRVFDRQQFEDGTVLGWLKEYEVTHIALAGFLWLMPLSLLEAFPSRVINIHPSLLPKFGGKGMYGMKVHQSRGNRNRNHHPPGQPPIR
jgi:phosphoribosylglycinamide formyltransferase-1